MLFRWKEEGMLSAKALEFNGSDCSGGLITRASQRFSSWF